MLPCGLHKHQPELLWNKTIAYSLAGYLFVPEISFSIQAKSTPIRAPLSR
jgi:hypothetical protein